MFGHGCSRASMPLEHAQNYGLGMDAVVTCSWDTNGIMVKCYHDRMLLEPERNYGLGMDALVIVCSWKVLVRSPMHRKCPLSHAGHTRRGLAESLILHMCSRARMRGGTSTLEASPTESVACPTQSIPEELGRNRSKGVFTCYPGPKRTWNPTYGCF